MSVLTTSCFFCIYVVIVIASSAQLSSQGVCPPSSTQEDELAAEVCVVQLQYLDSTEFGKQINVPVHFIIITEILYVLDQYFLSSN